MPPSHLHVYCHRWQDQAGQDAIQCIVKLRIPEWVDGLCNWQLDVVSRILNGEDVLVSTATGDGKSAIFAVPLIVLLELKSQSICYPNLPCQELPMGIVITPMKGLASNIVCSHVLVSFNLVNSLALM
jgi:replicative superfamily II helicase